MAAFTMSVTGSGISSPVERRAESAVGAEQALHGLLRQFGRYSAVRIWEASGREISKDRLATLARAERNLGAEAKP